MELAYVNGDTATFEDYREMIKQLVEAGVNINRKDEDGRTLLHRSILSDQNVNTTKLLTELVAHPFVPDNTGKTAIHYAVKATADKTGEFFGSKAVQACINLWWKAHRKQLFVYFFIFVISLVMFTTVCIYQTTRNQIGSAHISLSIQSKRAKIQLLITRYAARITSV
jgi:hypothetical protein